MFWIILIGNLLCTVVMIANNLSTEEEAYFSRWASVMAVWVLGLALGALLMHDTNEPKAIDVYRGNTELIITSVNGIPTDTTVVYKNCD